jgi:hypothetical protein
LGFLCTSAGFFVFLILIIIGQHNTPTGSSQNWSVEDQDMLDQVMIMDDWDEDENDEIWN